jgi:transcriptional regulator with XRE-family HTH domain
MNETLLSKRIRDIMRKQGMTQQDLASFLEMSQPAVSLYLRGRIPPADILYKIARIGETTMEWLLTGSPISEQSRVQEKSAAYGNQLQFLELWINLSPPVQRSLLLLMREIIGKANI